MFLEIISPETVLLQSEVSSVSVPGVNGAFQMLENHAPVVSVLQKGEVSFSGNPALNEAVKDRFSKNEKGYWTLPIESGTLEMNNNRVVILVD